MWVWEFYLLNWDIEGQEPGEHSAASHHLSVLVFSSQTPWAWPFLSKAMMVAGGGKAVGCRDLSGPRLPGSLPQGSSRLGHLYTEDTSVLHMLEAKQRTCGLGRVILIIFISQSRN